MTRLGRFAAVAAAAVLAGSAAAPAVASTVPPTWAPVTAGAPSPGYTTPADVAVAKVSCSGGTAGSWLQIPPSLVADMDIATGVQNQPPAWIAAAGEGVSSGSGDTCYRVQAVAMDGQTYGTPGSGASWVEVYPSGSWQAATGGHPSIATTGGANTAQTVGTGGQSVAGSVYAVQEDAAGNVTVATAPTLQSGSDVPYLHGSTSTNAPAPGCVYPDVLMERQTGPVGSVWQCVVPQTPGQTVAQTVSQGTSSLLPLSGSFDGRCSGGPRNGQKIPASVGDYNLHPALGIAWCSA